MSEWICLHCRSAELRAGVAPPGGTLVCAGCEYVYPLPLPGLPVVVPDPRTYVAAAFRAAHAAAAHGHAVAEKYEQAARGVRAGTLRELAAAIRATTAVLVSTGELLRPYLDPASLLTSADREAGVFDVASYMRRDWSGAPECEAELATLLGAVGRGLDAGGAADDGAALVLGAGAGRLSHELRRRFADVVSLDLTFAMAALLERMERETVELYGVYSGNHRRAANEAQLVSARVPEPPPGAGRHRVLVADASAVPLPDGSLDAVVSAYFTDLLPLSRWLPEVHRLLRPGGVFVHFGPLGYHHAEEAEMYAADQLVEVIGDAGFDVALHDYVPTTHLADPRLLTTPAFECLLLAAVRT